MKANESMLLNFITASSPSGLRRLMVLNNRRLGYFVDYKFVQQTNDGKWIAWYYANIEHDLSKAPIKGAEE